MKKERSRSYPVLDLGTAYEILVGKLSPLGSTRLDRDALAEVLGYSSAGGGIAARKISALIQYGMLEYRDELYELSSRGHRLQNFEVGTEEFLKAVRVALEKPALFKSILAKYRPIGQLPEDLAQVLTERYGITARASGDAEAVFLRSAIFARVMDAEGRFCEPALSFALPERERAVSLSPTQPRAEEVPLPEPTKPSEEGYPLPITGRRVAWLKMSSSMSAKDVEMLEENLLQDIKNGRLWDYLGVEKLIMSPVQAGGEKEPAADTGNVVPIRPHRET